MSAIAWRWRRRAVLVGVGVIGVLGSGGAQASAGTRVLTADLKGEYHYEDHFNSNGGVLNVIESYKWDEILSERVKVSRFGEVTVVGHRLTLVANGKIHEDGTNGTMPYNYDCHIQQAKVPSKIQPSITIEANGFNGAKLVGYAAYAGPPDLVGAEVMITGANAACHNGSFGSGALLSDNYHDGTVNSVFPPDPKHRWANAWSVLAQTKIGRIKLVPVSVDQAASTSTERASRFIHEALALGGKVGKLPPPSGETHETPADVRKAALDALQLTVSRALYPCLTAGTGAIVFGTLGAVFGPIVGSTMLALGAPVCARLVSSLQKLVLIYDDPPVANYNTVARVGRSRVAPVRFTKCPGSPVSARHFCLRLHAAAQTWLDALAHTAAVEAALATTIGRESAAARAHKRKALRRQQKAALALLPKLHAALRSDASAGRALERLLRSVNAHGSLTAAQTGQAVGIILSRLRHVHANVGQVRGAAPAALRPRAVDALTLLG